MNPTPKSTQASPKSPVQSTKLGFRAPSTLKFSILKSLASKPLILKSFTPQTHASKFSLSSLLISGLFALTLQAADSTPAESPKPQAPLQAPSTQASPKTPAQSTATQPQASEPTSPTTDSTSATSTPTPAPKSPSTLIQCNAIFEAKKGEIINQIQELEDKKQSLKVLQKASDELFTQRENKLKEQQQKLDATLKEIQATQTAMQESQQQSEDKVKQILTKNEDILRQIREETESKVAQTYAKMKDSKAAAILSDLELGEAANILFYLKPQEIGKILAKMEPKKAASLTEILKKGPPFDTKKPEPKAQPQEEHIPSIPDDKKKPLI